MFQNKYNEQIFQLDTFQLMQTHITAYGMLDVFRGPALHVLMSIIWFSSFCFVRLKSIRLYIFTAKTTTPLPQANMSVFAVYIFIYLICIHTYLYLTPRNSIIQNANLKDSSLYILPLYRSPQNGTELATQ